MDGVAAARPDAPPLAVAGARPYSAGGGADGVRASNFERAAAFYEAEYGVADWDAAAARTTAALEGAAGWLAAPGRGARAGALVLLAHNGPAGLGARASDPCGADFLEAGGDWGDPDTRDALAAAAAAGASPALVAFGHMHRSLRASTRPRTAATIDAATGTVHLNAAAWPRRVAVPGARVDGVTTARPATSSHFLLVELDAGVATRADDVWVDVDAGTGGCRVRSVAGLLRTEPATDDPATRDPDGRPLVVRSAYDGWAGEWAPPVASRAARGWARSPG